MTKAWLLISYTIIFFFWGGQYHTLQAQNEAEEVFLQFRYQNVVNVYISSLYVNDEFYLSANEIFNSLQIDFNVDSGRLVMQGNYLGVSRYTIDLNNQSATFQDRQIRLTADDFIISDLGYYLRPEIFSRLLNLEFIIDFNNLAIYLETDDTLPVIAQRERVRRRERLSRTQRELTRSFFPLEFDRNPSFFNAGFLDYNLTANFHQKGNSQYLYNTNLGTEFLGGDFQGSVFGSYSQTASVLRSSGLRWRYGILDNNWISTVTAGQTTSGGLAPTAFTGLKITNEPIEPRFLYGETAFTGSADPHSEAELYRNNTLVDFTETDESGSYRFIVPLTYGSSQYFVRIYDRTGQMVQRRRQVNIPFHFLPPGEITYNLSAGRLDNPVSGSTNRGMVSKANINAGITSWLSASGGVEHFEDFHENMPTLYGSVSSRILTNYLLTFEGASDAFYRARASVIYPSNASVNIDYTIFNQPGGLYNPERNQYSLRANFFTPFSIGSLPLFLRGSFTNNRRENGQIFRYRADINSRIGRMNLRFGYRDTQIGSLALQSTPVSRLQIASSYNFSQSRHTFSLLRGVFVRARLNYIPAVSNVEDVELQVSRNVFGRGRFNFSAGHNFSGNYNLFRFTLAFDFNKVRSNTSVRSIRESATYTQSVRGSVGFDSSHNHLLLTNRQQAGRSGLAVRLFVDQNNSGTYDPNDELITGNAIRLDRAGGNTFSKNGITYISQLQPYRRYNMTINKGAVPNPLLVPDLTDFSLVTDPNQYKLIEIPFYMSGVADGMIYRVSGDEKKGLGGIRLFLTQVNVPEGSERYSEEIRTFSDGSFYSYEIPPGDYELRVDPSQLDFMNVHPQPEFLSFTIRPLAEGDFAEELELNLYPDGIDRPTESLSELGEISVRSVKPACAFSVQAGSFSTIGNAFHAVDEFTRKTSLEYDIYYHPRPQLYSVRTHKTFPLPRAIEQAEIIQTGIGDDIVAVINQCSGQRTSGEPLAYQIQLASFSSEHSALRYQNQLKQRFNLNSFILTEEDPDHMLYKVRIGPFYSPKIVRDVFQTIKNKRIADDAFYTYDPGSVTNKTYEMKIQAGRFTDEEEAGLYARKIRSDYNTATSLLTDGEYFNVMVDKKYESWEDILKDYYRFAENSGFQTPAIHLIEGEP